MKGHEFHYFESTACGEDCQLEKASTKSKYSAMVVDENRVMGFPHLYYNSQPGFIQEFVEVMKKYSKRKRVWVKITAGSLQIKIVNTIPVTNVT